MKKFIISLLIVAAFVAIPVSVFAQQGASAEDVPASAKIITPISIERTGTLNFGTMTSPTSTATVTLDFAADRTFTSGVTLVTAAGEAITSAVPTFTVNGEINATYSISFPEASITLTDAVSSETMTVSTFLHNAGTDPQLDGTGEDEFQVSATLEIASGQTSGVYDGFFDVNIAYN